MIKLIALLLLVAGCSQQPPPATVWEAVERNDAVALMKMIENGQSVHTENEIGKTLLMRAAELNHPQIAKVLIEKAAIIDYRMERGSTALIFAAESSPEITQMLIDQGADVNAENKDGTTSLVGAIYATNVKTAKILLEHGARLKGSGKLKVDPIGVAEVMGFQPMIKLLNEQEKITSPQE